MTDHAKFTVSLSYEDIAIPPFEDILILTTKCRHGKNGLALALDHLALRDDFDLIELQEELVEAILINKRLLQRMPADTIINILRANVFPGISPGEYIKVDFHVRITHDAIQGVIE